MLENLIRRTGLSGGPLRAASMGSIGLCIGLWIRAKTVSDDERGNAERRALFVGHWAPMFWLIGETLERLRSRPTSAREKRRAIRRRLSGAGGRG